jgi:hypothetical protein
MSRVRRFGLPLAGVVAAIAFLVVIARFWHPVYEFTALFQLDASNDDLKLAAFRELPVYVHRDTGGYDGLYYAQIALAPSLHDPALPGAIDNLSYRARRILPPALAWLLGGGQPAWIIRAYSVLNLFAWFGLAWLLWRGLPVEDLRGLLAWSGVVFSAGTLASVRLALTDLPALVLIAFAALAAERQRPQRALTVVALSGLARETALLGGVTLLERPWLGWRNARCVLIAAAPLAIWLAYVRLQVGPADQGWGNFSWPVTGVVAKARDALHAALTLPDQMLAVTSLLALVALLAQAAFFATRWRPDDRWWRVGATYSVLLLWLGTAVWEGFPGAATRVLLPLTLAFNVVVVRTRASVIWLIAGNLSIAAGLVALRDAPHDRTELGASRVGGTAAVARTGEGWYGREADRRHVWYWARERGAVALETWPRVDATVPLEFSLRSVAARTVLLEQDGVEVWRGQIGSARTTHRVTLHVRGGRASLVFRTPEPPVREADSPAARELGFALYDLRLALPGS